jgi:hypothetical protein
VHFFLCGDVHLIRMMIYLVEERWPITIFIQNFYVAYWISKFSCCDTHVINSSGKARNPELQGLPMIL